MLKHNTIYDVMCEIQYIQNICQFMTINAKYMTQYMLLDVHVSDKMLSFFQKFQDYFYLLFPYTTITDFATVDYITYYCTVWQ